MGFSFAFLNAWSKTTTVFRGIMPNTLAIATVILSIGWECVYAESKEVRIHASVIPINYGWPENKELVIQAASHLDNGLELDEHQSGSLLSYQVNGKSMFVDEQSQDIGEPIYDESDLDDQNIMII